MNFDDIQKLSPNTIIEVLFKKKKKDDGITRFGILNYDHDDLVITFPNNNLHPSWWEGFKSVPMDVDDYETYQVTDLLHIGSQFIRVYIHHKMDQPKENKRGIPYPKIVWTIPTSAST